MSFTEAIASGIRNYLNFSARASRSEFWFWALFAFILAIIAGIIDFEWFGDEDSGLAPVSSLLSLALLLPNLAISVRRLHDGDRSGWWILLFFIPLIGAIIILIWYCMRGTPGPNRFGPDPLATPPSGT